MAAKKKKQSNQPRIENRKARYDYHIFDTLECGIKLVGTEVKSVRQGRVTLSEGYVRASEVPLSLELHSIHISTYPPAGPKQHAPTRTRTLLAHKREIKKLAIETREKGITLVPLKMYFLNGRAKLLIGVARGKQHADKRQDLAKRQAQRDIQRAMSKRTHS